MDGDDAHALINHRLQLGLQFWNTWLRTMPFFLPLIGDRADQSVAASSGDPALLSQGMDPLLYGATKTVIPSPKRDPHVTVAFARRRHSSTCGRYGSICCMGVACSGVRIQCWTVSSAVRV